MLRNRLHAFIKSGNRILNNEKLAEQLAENGPSPISCDIDYRLQYSIFILAYKVLRAGSRATAHGVFHEAANSLPVL